MIHMKIEFHLEQREGVHGREMRKLFVLGEYEVGSTVRTSKNELKESNPKFNERLIRSTVVHR